MGNKKIFCLATSKTFGLEQTKQLDKFKEHGVNGFFSVYQLDSQIYALKDHAEKKGMFFQSIHAPYLPMRAMWEDKQKGKEIVDRVCECLKCAGQAQVKKVVMHLISSFDEIEPTKLGSECFEQILECAEKYGIILCAENLEWPNILDFILTEYGNCPNLKLCYDTGHEHCYNNYEVIQKHFLKMGAVHINDNLGLRNVDGSLNREDDLHLLPFDGTVNFDRVCDLMVGAGFTDELTFELKIQSFPESEKYRKMDFDDYLSLAYQRMSKIRQMLDEKLKK